MRTSTLFFSLVSTALTTLTFPLNSLDSRQSTSPPNEISLIALSTNPSIHGQTVSASGTHFLINHPTTTSCPLPSPECTHFSNTTSLAVGANGGGADLLAGVPGSQGVYVAPATGALSFTAANASHVFPQGAIGTGFYVNSTVWGGFEFDFVKGGATVEWIACPAAESEGENVWQVLARIEGVAAVCADAAEMTIAAVAVSGFGAYQYD